MANAESKIFYTRDSFRNIFFFYGMIDDQRVSLGHLHVPKDKPIPKDKLNIILRKHRELIPATINVRVSDILDKDGKPHILKIVKFGDKLRWMYTYSNGKKKSMLYNSATKRADALYFSALIKARFDIDEGAISAIIIDHSCLNLV